MIKIVALVVIVTALTACQAPEAQTPHTAATGTPQVHVPNPASVYCTQQGNTLEIVTAADGSQSGVCHFPDGTSCDEWAYFRGECGPAAQQSPTPGTAVEATTAPGTTEEVSDWWGIIKGNQPGAQFDDCFERQDLGQAILFGIDSMDPAVQAQIKALRDSGKMVHLYGTLLSNVPDCNGSQIQVERIETEEDNPGSFITPETREALSDWWGVIKSNPPGAQFDDCFERQDLGQAILFGIDSLDPAVLAQIKTLRDSGKIVHLYGTLLSNVPDCNGSQIQVERIEADD